MARIFIIEDNDSLRETIASYLKLEDHQVQSFAALSGVEEAIRAQKPDLLVLDVMLPDGDGFLFARRIRRWSKVAIIFLTARSSESDRITGFETGGDDYLVKPFSNKELMLRIKALLRRSNHQEAGPVAGVLYRSLEPGNGKRENRQILKLDTEGHFCHIGDQRMDLTAAEWKILNFLAENPGRVYSRQQLLTLCLDYQADGSERTIDTHVKNIRIKLKQQSWIETVRGFGYRFAGEESKP